MTCMCLYVCCACAAELRRLAAFCFHLTIFPPSPQLVEHGKRDGHAATLLKKAIAAAKPGGECKPGCKPESKPVVNVKMEAVI